MAAGSRYPPERRGSSNRVGADPELAGTTVRCRDSAPAGIAGESRLWRRADSPALGPGRSEAERDNHRPGDERQRSQSRDDFACRLRNTRLVEHHFRREIHGTPGKLRGDRLPSGWGRSVRALAARHMAGTRECRRRAPFVDTRRLTHQSAEHCRRRATSLRSSESYSEVGHWRFARAIRRNRPPDREWSGELRVFW